MGVVMMMPRWMKLQLFGSAGLSFPKTGLTRSFQLLESFSFQSYIVAARLNGFFLQTWIDHNFWSLFLPIVSLLSFTWISNRL
jgi:hypothetical protein